MMTGQLWFSAWLGRGELWRNRGLVHTPYSTLLFVGSLGYYLRVRTRRPMGVSGDESHRVGVPWMLMWKWI